MMVVSPPPPSHPLFVASFRRQIKIPVDLVEIQEGYLHLDFVQLFFSMCRVFFIIHCL